jgi:hypothetical protein
VMRKRRGWTDKIAVVVDTSSANAPAPTVSLSEIDQTSRGEGQGLETVRLTKKTSDRRPRYQELYPPVPHLLSRLGY